MFKTFAKPMIFTSLAALFLTSAGMADTKPPKGSQPTDPKKIHKLYAGKTSYWNSGGSAYWGPNGQLESTGTTGREYGVGKWYVTSKSKLCQDATYYWLDGNTVKSEDWKGCWEFKTAPDGVVWERFLPDKTKWYKHKTEKQKRGNGNAKAFKANRKKVGL